MRVKLYMIAIAAKLAIIQVAQKPFQKMPRSALKLRVDADVRTVAFNHVIVGRWEFTETAEVYC